MKAVNKTKWDNLATENQAVRSWHCQGQGQTEAYRPLCNLPSFQDASRILQRAGKIMSDPSQPPDSWGYSWKDYGQPLPPRTQTLPPSKEAVVRPHRSLIMPHKAVFAWLQLASSTRSRTITDTDSHPFTKTAQLTFTLSFYYSLLFNKLSKSNLLFCIFIIWTLRLYTEVLNII